MKFTDLKCCPFCESETYYEKQFIKGSIEFNSSFNGNEVPNYEMYEEVTHTYSGRCYCCDCDKYVGNNLRNTVSKEAEKLLNNLVCHSDTLVKENNE